MKRFLQGLTLIVLSLAAAALLVRLITLVVPILRDARGKRYIAPGDNEYEAL